MKRNTAHFQSWREWDRKSAISHSSFLKKKNRDVSTQVFIDLKLGKYKSADLSTQINEIDPIMRLKTHLLRGQFKDAQELIDSLKKITQSALDLSELLQREAQLAMHEARYSDALKVIEMVLQNSVDPTTRLALLQMMALCHLELGAWGPCIESINKAKILVSLFPQSTSRTYLMATEARWLAQTQSVATARRFFIDEWSVISLENRDLDQWLTYMRLETYLAQVENSNAHQYALASLQLARVLGDEFYESLALIDLMPSAPQAVQNLLTSALQKYPRIQKLHSILKNSGEKIDFWHSAQVLKNHQAQIFLLDLNKAYSHIYLKDLGICLDLSASLSQIVIKKISREDKAIVSMAKGVVSLEDFFKDVWGQNKYVQHLHYDGIRKLVSRVRKKLKLEVEISQNAIRAEKLLVV